MTTHLPIEEKIQGIRAALSSATRLVLAATLSSVYGIYSGFELCENRAKAPGSEEYLDSEKYELKAWKFDRPESLGGILATVNRARRENPALQYNDSLCFHPTDNERILCYSKRSRDDDNLIVVVVSLNFHDIEQGFIELPLGEWGITPGKPFVAHDLLGDRSFTWQDGRNFVELDPQKTPAHIFRIDRT